MSQQSMQASLNQMTHQLSQTAIDNSELVYDHNHQPGRNCNVPQSSTGYQVNDSYPNYMHPSSNLSPISPSFPINSRPPHVFYNSSETPLRSPTTAVPQNSYTYPNGFPALKSNVDPSGMSNSMAATLESNGNGRIIPPRLNLSHSTFRHDSGNMFSPFPVDMRRSERSDGLLPSPAMRPPMNSAVHPSMTPTGHHPFDSNNNPLHSGVNSGVNSGLNSGMNSALLPSMHPMHPPPGHPHHQMNHNVAGMHMYPGGPHSFPHGYGQPGTPLAFNDQLKFLAQNPQYLSGLAGQALGNSGKISRAIAAQLFARDENTDRFPCTLCGQSFKRINGLKRHLMMHLHIKPYKCDMCGRGFCRIDVFKRHVARARCLKES